MPSYEIFLGEQLTGERNTVNCGEEQYALTLGTNVIQKMKQ